MSHFKEIRVTLDEDQLAIIERAGLSPTAFVIGVVAEALAAVPEPGSEEEAAPEEAVEEESAAGGEDAPPQEPPPKRRRFGRS